MIIKVYQDDSSNGAVKVQTKTKTKPLHAMTTKEVINSCFGMCRG